MKYFAWLLKAVIFFVLFAFALNNQAPVDLHLFFGTTWQSPLVLVVLTTFIMGLFAGIAIMLPIWWAARRKAREGSAPPPMTQPSTNANANANTTQGPHGT